MTAPAELPDQINEQVSIGCVELSRDSFAHMLMLILGCFDVRRRKGYGNLLRTT